MTTDLAATLRELRPRLKDGVYAFCQIEDGRAIPSGTVGWFREDEGITIILPFDEALAAGLAVDFQAAWITLGLETSLEGVGLTAAVSGALAAAGIACNVAAARRHDHLFVPYPRGADALQILRQCGENPQSPRKGRLGEPSS
jgi:hypothetical protein